MYDLKKVGSFFSGPLPLAQNRAFSNSQANPLLAKLGAAPIQQ
jgi:hypothetical protein